MGHLCFIPVLSVAGSDPSGGAGVQADIKTLSALGCYAAAAVTALTVQDTLGVSMCRAVDPDLVAAQIRAVMDDLRPRVVKIGMLGNGDVVRAVAQTLEGYPGVRIVLDPVICASSGAPLIDNQGIEVMKQRLVPMAEILTPNLPEAELLTGISTGISTGEAEGEATNLSLIAERLLAMGCRYVLLKGGHAPGAQKTDRLYFRDADSDSNRDADGHGHGLQEIPFTSPTLLSANTHGTGCTLASAIAAYLARGYGMPQAVGEAKRYVSAAIEAAADVRTGHGHGPLNHLFAPVPMIKTAPIKTAPIKTKGI